MWYLSAVLYNFLYIYNYFKREKKSPLSKFYKSEFPDIMLEFHNARNQIAFH